MAVNGKVCIVTGAAQGIGRSVAIKLAQEGAEAVVIADVNTVGGEQTAELVRAAGSRASFIETDLADADAIRRLPTTVAAEFGHLDVLVNNAGIIDSALSANASLETLEEPIWDLVMMVNLKATWLMMKHCAPLLRASTLGPSIVNTASVCALTGYPGVTAYGASKAAIVQLTKDAAVALAPVVRVNCFSPGSVDTPMRQRVLDSAVDKEAAERRMALNHLIPRAGHPEEIANVVEFLASDASSFMTGTNILVDGGTLAWRGSR
jgi:NAD(P)-dependent dehydrogenase (short-subunit alcohol dehydrogenase family)